MRQVLDCHYLYMVRKLFLAEYVKIFQQHFFLVKPQKAEKYALLSYGTCVVQNVTDESLTFCSCECTTIFMLLHLKTELQVKEGGVFDCFGRKQ